MSFSRVCLSLFLIAVLAISADRASADNTVAANADTWVADNSPGSNFETDVNPSSQLRNAGSVRRVSFYEWTLPEVGAHETVTDVEVRLEEFFGGSSFVADFGLLNSVPDLTAITYTSAINDGFLGAGNDSNQNPIIGGNTNPAGNLWTVAGGTGTLTFVDGGAGLTSLVAGAAGANPQTATLALIPQDPAAGATNAGFSGNENSESSVAFPHPRLTVRKSLTAPTDVVVATADTYIQSTSGGTNFSGSVNPSTQLRNNSGVTRASLFNFTLPQLGAGEFVAGVQVELNQFFDGAHFSAEWSLLDSQADLSTITWDSANTDGYINGLDGSSNPILGSNATGAGDVWELFGDDSDDQHFADGDASDGLAALIAAAASTSGPVDITLMLTTVGQQDLGVAAFYGLENGEGGGFTPHPRLRLTIVPEPTSVVLLALGGCLALVRRRS